MLTCPYCGSETSSEYNLCENCEQQVKCAKQGCGALLRPHKSKCLMCGTPTLGAQQVDPSMNRYVHTATSTSKSHTEHTEITVSDIAIGDFIPLVLSRGQSQPRPQPRPAAIRVNPQSQPKLPFPAMVEDKDEAYTDATDNNETPVVTEVPPTSQSKQDENQALALQFFEAFKDELTPLNPDFKGNNRKEQIVRFFITYVWSYQHIFGKPVPSKDHMLAATKRAGLPNDNFRQYFDATASRVFVSPDGTFKVNPAGNVEAKRVFDEMQTKSEPGVAYWDGKGKQNSKRARFNQEDQGKINEWVLKEINVEPVDVRSLTATQLGLLAYWILKVGIGVADLVKPSVAFTYLSTKFPTIQCNINAFTKALSRDSNDKRFGRNSDGLYFIHEDGEKEVQAWLKTGVPTTTEPPEVAGDEGEAE